MKYIGAFIAGFLISTLGFYFEGLDFSTRNQAMSLWYQVSMIFGTGGIFIVVFFTSEE